ncbi:glycosyltransferase family 4 protein [Cupriavidus basilensis]|uniref:glycosyltransferase family 4 protein n=1 Tax=Cupriavidus basilensis TaxID=68895 RepID=UPI0007519490|nr:glycosyltransferase family 4 protein [Cupriavidus basilensis]
MKVLLLTRYGRMGASSRLRMLQFLPWLKEAGLESNAQALLDDEMLQKKYRSGGYNRRAMMAAYGARMRSLGRRRESDLVWIEKEALPWFPASVEHALLRGVPYVLDYDDALFHNYDLHRSMLVRRLMGRRIDRLMAGARLVVAGNEYLAKRAREAGARWVEIVPTVIDLDRYRVGDRPSPAGVTRIVWIGSPSTAAYLEALEEPLRRLAARHQFKLRVIGADVSMHGVDVECLPWSEGSEVAAIAECHVGIMPLKDSPWERGKCGYKLIQYMACGLPVVASPVGVNVQIVRDGENGFLADGPQAWETRLGQLLENESLRESMGRAGRCRVEQEYCVQQVAPRLTRLLLQAGAR